MEQKRVWETRQQEPIVKQGIMAFAKNNRIRSKVGMRDETNKEILQFFENLNGKVEGMKGFSVMNDPQDSQISTVLTFWETKDYMDTFYQSGNTVLSSLVEKLKSSFEQPPERKDYQIVAFAC
jgi:heme-degrading monooxygenase HmoA